MPIRIEINNLEIKSGLIPTNSREIEANYQEKMNKASPAERMEICFTHEMEKRRRLQPAGKKWQFLPPTWRSNLK